MKHYFEYFWNAIFYNIYKYELWSSKIMHKHIFSVISLLPDCLKTKSMKNPQISIDYWTRKDGPAYHWTVHRLSYLSFFCGMGMGWILLGVLLHIYKSVWLVLVCLIPSVLVEHYVTKIVLEKGRYKDYFKQFKMKSPQWHRKWKYITIFTFICSITVFFFGIVLTSMVYHWI